MKVTRILNDCVKSGDNWSQASVELSDGQIVRIFNPVMVGDEVESYQNGKYTNWKVKKDNQAVKYNDDVEKLINTLGREVQTLSGAVERLEVRLRKLEDHIFQPDSRLNEIDDMPEDFLKI